MIMCIFDKGWSTTLTLKAWATGPKASISAVLPPPPPRRVS